MPSQPQNETEYLPKSFLGFARGYASSCHCGTRDALQGIGVPNGPAAVVGSLAALAFSPFYLCAAAGLTLLALRES